MNGSKLDAWLEAPYKVEAPIIHECWICNNPICVGEAEIETPQGDYLCSDDDCKLQYIKKYLQAEVMEWATSEHYLPYLLEHLDEEYLKERETQNE